MTPRFSVRDIAFAERLVAFRTPFRFGAITVTEAPQIFLSAEIETEDGRRCLGVTAELMVPKWFNKNPDLTPAETVEQLRRAVDLAREIYLDAPGGESAFALHARCHDVVLAQCAEDEIPGLAAAFGPAQIDKAILDALLRVHGLDVFSGLKRNIVGLDNRLTPDIDPPAIAAYLTSRNPSTHMMVRHTVGMADPLHTLADVWRDTGCRYFKLKLSGDPDADIDRLSDIADVLAETGADYRVTLDANEQYADLSALSALGTALHRTPLLSALTQRLLYVEQPLPRDLTWTTPLGAFGAQFAVIVDEAESSYDAFPKALALGYRGISSKACKGLYKSLLNGVRAHALSGGGGSSVFVAAEDLTCQTGLAVQQDTALVAFHGIAHAERNGHHYVDGFASTPDSEARAFLKAHPDLYEEQDGHIRLAVHDGALSIASLRQTGFASGVDPHLIASHLDIEAYQKQDMAT
jgi:hypothetical protein